MTHNPTPPLPSPPAPDDPVLAAGVRASTDGLPEGETLPVVPPLPPETPSPAGRGWWAKLPRAESPLIPLGISMLSLFLSLIVLLQASLPPQLALVLPQYVRVATAISPTYHTQIILQPAFINTSPYQRTETITDLDLTLFLQGSAAPIDFDWTQMGTLLLTADKRAVTYDYKSDPLPLVVSSTDPQLPVLFFVATDTWSPSAGVYSVVLTARATVAHERLERRGKFTLTADEAQQVNNGPPGVNHRYRLANSSP